MGCMKLFLVMLAVVVCSCAATRWEQAQSGRCADAEFTRPKGVKSALCPHPKHIAAARWSDDNKETVSCVCLR